jgi:ComF family protein
MVLPSNCAGCGSPRLDAGGGGFCAGCWAGFPRFDPDATCPTCALPTGGATCRSCAAAPPPVARTVAYGPYEGGLRRLVRALKFEGHDIVAAPAASRLAETIRWAGLRGLEAVVAVPSTRRRNRERGYDPAALIARELARRLALPLVPALRRVGETPPQSALTAAARRANVAGAFRGRAIAAGRSLLLVDDVLTTGATAFASAEALITAGARRIGVAVLARTPEPSP